MSEVKIFHKGNGIDVSGVYDLETREAILFKGSKIATTEKDAFKDIPEVYKKYHNLIDTGKIKDGILTEDCV